jgi:hypothetical protein
MLVPCIPTTSVELFNIKPALLKILIFLVLIMTVGIFWLYYSISLWCSLSWVMYDLCKSVYVSASIIKALRVFWHFWIVKSLIGESNSLISSLISVSFIANFVWETGAIKGSSLLRFFGLILRFYRHGYWSTIFLREIGFVF